MFDGQLRYSHLKQNGISAEVFSEYTFHLRQTAACMFIGPFCERPLVVNSNG
jgi:hypothetical protein